MRCPGHGASSAHEMTIGHGFPSPNQLDKGRIATCRANLGPGRGGRPPLLQSSTTRGNIWETPVGISWLYATREEGKKW